MKKGEAIHGYRVVSDPTTSGGGRCVWAFAEKAGSRFFLKQFLDPKWPTSSSMGSPASKDRRRQECIGFEQRHQQVNSRINPTGAGGGNLVTAVDFFREGTTYYKVTERVVALSMPNLHGVTARQTAVVMRTLCQSVRQLHRAGIVHGDLKPENVLLQRSPTGDLYLAKVIDFDDSYPTGDPPPPDQIVGDQRFAAPEWLRYVKQDAGAGGDQLTIAADIFALGLVFHVYLAGDLPGYDQTRFFAPAEAVRANERLHFDERLNPGMVNLLGAMTVLPSRERPSIDEVSAGLVDDTVLQVVAGPPKPAPPRPAPTRAGSSRVRINMNPATPPTPRPPSRPSVSESRLRRNFDR